MDAVFDGYSSLELVERLFVLGNRAASRDIVALSAGEREIVVIGTAGALIGELGAFRKGPRREDLLGLAGSLLALELEDEAQWWWYRRWRWRRH